VPEAIRRTLGPVATRTIWWEHDGPDAPVVVIDQTALPHHETVRRWHTVDDAADGISSMQVRGAPLIGVAAAHGLALAVRHDAQSLDAACDLLAATRPTAVNLRWALEQARRVLATVPAASLAAAARRFSTELADADVASCRAIADAGLPLLEAIHERTGRPVQVLTHCNAGWLACVEWGTATAPIYLAHARGVPVHVWVSETRPRNQGAALTAWELGQRGVPHTLIVDNAAGHLLRTGGADLVVVGADRIAANGDVVNKIGTSLKALAAREFGVPFVVAAPRSTFDPSCDSGDTVVIEERDPAEVLTLGGTPTAPNGTPARNWGFDVTPARLVDRYLTDGGSVAPDEVAGFVSRLEERHDA
jgi:methylthioribose-1-phosphate isomerase